MGLVRRRHFAVEGRKLLGIVDELFGAGHLGIGSEADLGSDDDLDGTTVPATGGAAGPQLRGYSTLLAALERGRTGTLGDIVATIQSEQDEIIRSPQAGVLVVQGGPGTGKTVVALHRAAYLLYTHRFPLEDQGVLVIGPNRVFLRYIERVLPSLGEAGVEQVVLADLVPGVRFAPRGSDVEAPATMRVKGDPRMSEVLERAVGERERPLRDALVVPFRSGYVRLGVAESQRIVTNVARRFRRHNADGQRSTEFRNASPFLAVTGRHYQVRRAARGARGALRSSGVAGADPAAAARLFGSKALLRPPPARRAPGDQIAALTDRADRLADVVWSAATRGVARRRPQCSGRSRRPDRRVRRDPHPGHLVVDEVRDLTPCSSRWWHAG